MNVKNTRWVVDGSLVPSEWHCWLHCVTGDPLTTKPPTAHKLMRMKHKFKECDPPDQHVPYPTPRKKIQEWVPPSTP